MTNTEPLDLDAIEARANAATEGPWSAEDCDVWTEAPHMFGGTVHTVDDRYPRSGFNPDADAEFIAHARQDVPALIAEVRRLRGHTIGADDDPNVDTCWAVVLDDCGSVDLYETREEADAARANAPDTGLDYIVTTTVIPAAITEDPR